MGVYRPKTAVKAATLKAYSMEGFFGIQYNREEI